MKKNLALILSIALLGTMLAGCTATPAAPAAAPAAQETSAAEPEASGDVYTLRVGLPEALDNPIGIMATEIKNIAEEKSGGRLVLDLYPSNTLGGPREMLEAVGFDNLEMTVCTPTDMTSFVPAMGILTFPYLFKDADAAHLLIDGDVGKELSEAAIDANFKVLGYPDIGFRQITNNIRPITCLDDFKGIKIRTRGVTAHMTTFKEFGANPVSVSFDELYAALQQKVVDAQENSPTNIYFNNFYDVQKYLSVTNTFFESWSIVMSNNIYESLPDDLKAILQEAVDEGVKNQRAACQSENDEYLAKLSELMEVNYIEDDKMAEIMAAAQALYPQFADEVGTELVDRVLQAIQ